MAVSLDGLHPTLMRPRVEAVLADPEAKGMGLFVISAFRSIERQRVLFEAAVKKYGSERAARRWVAPPGKSNHGPKVGGYGTAVDFGVPGLAAVSGQWPKAIEEKVNRICARHGLYSPMDWEDWHFEPIPNWHPPFDTPPQQPGDDVNTKIVDIVCTANTGHGYAGTGIPKNDILSVTPLAADDGVVYKVGLNKKPSDFDGTGIVHADTGGPTLVDVTVQALVLHR